MLRALIGLSATVFTLWMLIDARQRRVEEWWYLIILMPLGEWAYFFTVKIRDFEIGFVERLWNPPPESLTTLKRRLDQSPSDANRLSLAWAHLRSDEPAQAAEHFADVLRRDPSDPSALHGLGLARIDMEEPAAAITPLQRLVEEQPAYDDYEAWHDLAYAHWQCDNRIAAVEVLRRLLEVSPRIQHRVVLGGYLVKLGESEAAREVLEQAVRDFDELPRHLRRSARRWIKQARALQAELA
ncbi:MAG: tetratricopeptide repeat protein [Myxococcota bacterium]